MKLYLILMLLTVKTCLSSNLFDKDLNFLDELTEPTPTEPAPTEPAPTEAAPTEAAPTEAAATKAAPTEAAPTEAAPTEPAATEPAPTEPAAAEANSVEETSNVATLVFTGDWQENVIGEVGVGENVNILYDGSRLPGRPTMYGQPAWKLYIDIKYSDNDEVHSTELSGPNTVNGEEIFTATIFTPYNATKLIIWFHLWTYQFGTTYDSNYGQNYHFSITAPSIVFLGNWEERVHGLLEAGKSFQLSYDSGRLGNDEDVFAQMKFSESGYVSTQRLSEPGRGHFLGEEIHIPDDAEVVILWFYHFVNGNQEYDSDYGKNYNFPIAV